MIGPMSERTKTRALASVCALGTMAGTLVWGVGVLILGLAVVAGVPLLGVARKRRMHVRPRPAAVRLRATGS
jgi:hypothetical protein